MHPHTHEYLLQDTQIKRNEQRTFIVVVLTFAMMLVEVTFGNLTKSMALLADGWHMASHAAALGISVVAYKLAKSKALSARFSFGTGKFIPLGGYTSAVLLAVVAVLMAIESLERFFAPKQIEFNTAPIVAVAGLVVNLASVFILREDKHAHDEHSHHHHHDHNLRGAYLHVLADALTSVLAIVALVIGKIYTIYWLDAAMGVVGGILILKWAYSLSHDTAWELLDGHAKAVSTDTIRALVETDGVKVVDLHVWRIAPKAHACEIIVKSRKKHGSAHYRELLARFPIRHLVVEEITD